MLRFRYPPRPEAIPGMFDPELVTFLESGCALIVASVSDDGLPLAGRGWGVTVRPDAPGEIRLLLDAEDHAMRANLHAGAQIAITACAVPTLRSQQLKGRVVSLDEASNRDRNRADRYCEAFYQDILQTDGTPRGLTNGFTPARYYACNVAVDDVFDQTPGPTAGTRVEVGTT
jgi:hypothetical protein